MATSFSAVGRATAIGTTRSDMWNVGGSYVFPPAATQMSVVSTSASDLFATGTGVRQITILYLDNNYAQGITTVNLNGLTPVLTTPTNILRINKVFSSQVGSGGSAAGTISITNGGNTYAQISTAYTASRQAVATVPAGQGAYIASCTYSAQFSMTPAFSEVDLRASSFGTVLLSGIFVTITTFGTSGGGFQQVFNPPIYVPPTTDVKMTASLTVGTGTATVAGGFSGFIDGTYTT